MYALCEVLLRMGIVCSCFIFMLFRSQLREKYTIKISSGKELDFKKKYKDADANTAEHVDFIHGNRLVIGTFGVIMTPFFMFYLSNWSEELFEVPTPTEHYSFQFFTLISAIQGVSAIPILFIKGRKFTTFWAYFNRFTAVMIMIGAAPWLIIIFMLSFKYFEYDSTLIWCYCFSNMLNLAYFLIILMPASKIKPESLFKLTDDDEFKKADELEPDQAEQQTNQDDADADDD